MLSDLEKARLINRSEDSHIRANNDMRVRKKLTAWFKDNLDAYLILNHLPEDQLHGVISDEDVFRLLTLAAKAMEIKDFHPVVGEVNRLETWQTALEKCRTELYKVKYGAFAEVNRPGRRQLDVELVTILRRGQLVESFAILKELRINPADSDAVKLVENQIAVLRGFGLVKETANGWRWVEHKDKGKA
jgi:hypothetical protein